MQFNIIVSLVAAEHVLSILVPLPTALQSKICNLEKAANIAANVVAEPSMDRNVGRQQNRANAPVHTISEYREVNMYVPFLDH
ncbi:hypothetical protein MAR_001127 [Mya arenaria]|uniref:Uncharacterized protein n=1 Tax=Mya arenaria TaxID=6604 RepID=A0ABY7FD38_MYAAR|nr:hypothetical protein MAR_001127 [Mya arenaria]